MAAEAGEVPDIGAVTDQQGKPVTEPGFRMIDPACGSGHFLLGAFPRILDRWQKQDPSGKIRDLVQKNKDWSTKPWPPAAASS